jgi:hypothetical protein
MNYDVDITHASGPGSGSRRNAPHNPESDTCDEMSELEKQA